LVDYEGTETEVTFKPSAVLAYAQGAAKQFGVGTSRTVQFDSDAANNAIKERVDKDGGKAKKVGRRKKAA
jgi:hypothetical protein